MSGWIKLEKSLSNDPRVIRMSSRLRNADVTLGDRARALVLGSLTQLWCYADTHVRADDTLDLGVSEIDELVGVPGFASLMPAEWLEVIDENTVKLPDFHAHNGTESRKKAQNQKRQQRYRNAKSVTEASPDQDQTKTKTKDTERVADFSKEKTDQPDTSPSAATMTGPASQGGKADNLPAISEAVQLAIDLRAMGVIITSQHPALHQWLKDGFTPAQIRECVSIARISKPKPEAIPANYLTPILQDIKNPSKSRRAEAREHWQKVMAAVRSGAYRKEGFTLGETIDKAVRAIGGYSALGSGNVSAEPFNEKKFRDAYAELAA